MSLETDSVNAIRANRLEVKFKLIIIYLTLFVNRAQGSKPLAVGPIQPLSKNGSTKTHYNIDIIYVYIAYYVTRLMEE